jgi:hypothetical protein
MRKELFADHRVTDVPDTPIYEVVMDVNTSRYREPKTIRPICRPLSYLRYYGED